MSLVENYLLNFLTILIINYSKSSKLELSWFFVRYALVLIKCCNRSGLPKVNISVLFAILSLSFWWDNLSLFTQNNWRMAAVNCTQPYYWTLDHIFLQIQTLSSVSPANARYFLDNKTKPILEISSHILGLWDEILVTIFCVIILN